MHVRNAHSAPAVSNSASPLVLAFTLLGCSAAGAVEPKSGGTVLSESGALSVTWDCVSADAPARGRNRFELLIESTETDAPVDGLSLAMTPFMPAMGHGSSTVPSVRALGDGKYDVSDVVLAMPGQWELRTSISGEESDYAVPRVEIE